MSFKKTGKPVLVIDVGSYNIKFVVATTNGVAVTVLNAFSVPTPEKTYSDGVILDHDALVDAIKQALRIHSVKIKQTIVTFTSTEIITRNWTSPKLSYDDMIGMIRYEISQYLPINIDDYDVTYKVNSTVVEENTEKYNLSAYVVKKSIISGLHALIKDCGLNPLVLDVHSNCIAKLAEAVDGGGGKSADKKGEPQTTKVFVDIGYKNILVNIFKGTEGVLTRVINKGLSGLDEMIAEKMKIPLSEAEDLRIKKFSEDLLGLYDVFERIKFIDFSKPEIDKADYDLGQGYMSNQEKVLFDLLRDCMIYFTDMVSEINKVLRYYLSRNSANKIDIVYYYGTPIDNLNLFEFFSTYTEFTSKRLDFDKVDSVVFKAKAESKVSYANAIGGVLRRKEGKHA